MKDLHGEKQIERYVQLGRTNQEVLGQLHTWCKHLEAVPTSSGLLAGLSGLPIGSFRLSCQHAAQALDGMVLSWTSCEFLDQNCRNCRFQESDGDLHWGREVLTKIDSSKAEAARHEREILSTVEELRRECRVIAGQGRSIGNLTEHQILTWTEQIFDRDQRRSRDAAENLFKAAKVAPDLFGEPVIIAICRAGTAKTFSRASLPILKELAERRPDLSERLTATALSAIYSQISLEYSCAILCETRPNWDDQIRRQVIEHVVGSRNHIRPIGGWPTRDPQCDLVDIPPSYEMSDTFLLQEYDRDSATVCGVIKDALRATEPNRRINACGVLRGLMRLRPLVGNAFASELVASLEMVDNEDWESADHAVCNTLMQAFLLDPNTINRIIRQSIELGRPPIQSLLIDVYTKLLNGQACSTDDNLTIVNDHQMQEAITVGLQSLLQLLHDKKLDIDPLGEVVQAIHIAGCNHPEKLIEQFSVLLGTLASWSMQPDAKPAPVALLIPGAMPITAAHAEVEKGRRNSRWSSIKREFGDALAEVVDKYSHKLSELLLSTFNNLDSMRYGYFKCEVVRLLGVLGRRFDLLPRILPCLWDALIDSSSASIRCRGTEAIRDCFGHSKYAPPANVVDKLVRNLKDPYIGVHQAAIRIIGDNPEWLTEDQVVEAMQCLDDLIQVYKLERPYSLESIAETLLKVSRRAPHDRDWAVNVVLSLIPSGESLLDQQLIMLLTRNVRSVEGTSRSVAEVVVRWIGTNQRDTYDYCDRMGPAFSWLFNLPLEVFHEIRPGLIEEALKTGTNHRKAICFASLFSSYEDYEGEYETLSLLVSKLPSGRQFEEMVKAIEKLADVADRNATRSRVESI